MLEVHTSLALASSNPGKIRQFQSRVNNPNEAGNIPAFFNEDFIKEQCAPLKHTAFEYAAHISRAKFSEQRNYLQANETQDTNYTVIVSDSLVVTEKAGQFIAVNRDDSVEEHLSSLSEINRLQKLTYVGAVTFGSKKGQGITTALTYVDVPLSEQLTQIPSPQDLPKIKDPSRPYEVGYIQVGLDENNNHTYSKKRIDSPWAFDDNQKDDARPYISGLTTEVVALADEIGKFERQIEPILQSTVQAHPFNTLSFYNSLKSNDQESFYSQIVSENNSYFDRHGGNCVLFTIHTGNELKKKGFDFKANYIAPSSILSSGHTALIVQNMKHTLSFFVDPGLSLVQPIVLQQDIPLYPFVFSGDKKIFVATSSEESPHLRIHTKKAKSDLHLSQPIEFSDFVQDASHILQTMHSLRKIAKLDYHDNLGKSICSCSVNLDKKTVSLKAGELSLKDIPIGHFLSQPDALQALDAHLDSAHISSEYLIHQLSQLISQEDN